MLYFTIKAGECMNSINIYNLTRVSDNEDFAEYEYILSGRKDFQRTRIREKESLIILVRELIKAGERQILPWQMNSIFIMFSNSLIFLVFTYCFL